MKPNIATLRLLRPGQEPEAQRTSRKVKLTKRFVESVSPSDRDVWRWDTELPGFGLRVKPSGVRIYLIQYRNAGGRTRRLALGRHGVLTAEEARLIARQRLAQTKAGRDPSAERHAKRSARTVAQLCDRYLKEHAIVHKKVSSVREDHRLITSRILPALGPLKAEAVTREDVMRLHQAMVATPYEANRTLALLSKMFNLAEVWRVRPDGSNPCRHVRRYTEHERRRFLSDEELGRLGEVLNEAERTRTEQAGAIIAIRLLAFTGCRLSEIC